MYKHPIYTIKQCMYLTNYYLSPINPIGLCTLINGKNTKPLLNKRGNITETLYVI